jgi:TolB-like protein/Flp pilus assembly protein TadD
MAIPLASDAVAICSKCGEPLNAQGDCTACLLRTGLDESVVETKPLPSLVFGDFEVEQRADGFYWELGHGAMGVTYLAMDKVLRRRVALKVIDVPEAARGSQAVRDRFLREARAAAALRHPNVAAVFQFGASPDGSRCYYAMELVEGETLETRVRRDGPLKVEPALEIAIQITRALMAAAAHDLIHRDLKPGNIMLTGGNDATTEVEVKVIDFGLAKAIADAGGDMDLTHGEFVGTPNFASPEQFGSGPIDARSDIYSLGATLWFALTGLAPRSGSTIEEIRDRQTRDDLPVEQLVTRKVPEPVIKLLRRTLAVDPSKRPASARELMEALESCRRKLAHRIGVFYKLTALVVAVAIVAAALFALRVNRQKITSASARNIAPSAAALTPLAEKSIAVLPLENLSEEKENAFFADGIQDELLSSLSKIADLKVISRTSVMQYKSGIKRNLKEIAQQLGVSHVVEGNVRRAGNRVRVSVQLIDARTDTHLWAEHYERDVTDVFAIQTEIAQQIADQLQAKLSPAEKAAITERPTADPVAYALYTQAKAIDVRSDWEGVDKSLNRQVELVEKATQRDPNFALAYCALAEAQGFLYLVTGDRKHLELAKKAAEAALRVRPDLGETHLALARYYFCASFARSAPINTGNFDRAREELTIARRKLPNDSEALFIAARIDRHQNRWDSALANFQKANDLDPRNREFAQWLGETYSEMRRYHESEEVIKKCAASGTLEEPRIQNALAEIRLAQGDPVAAQSLLDQVPLDFSPDPFIWQTRFNAALYLRDYDAADRVIAATPAKWADGVFVGQPPESWADGQVALARGDKQKALAVFAAARQKLDAKWSDKPKDARYFEEAAMLDVGLGRKEDAIREARRAVDLMPIAKSSVNGPLLVTNLALVYAWTGERDRALEQLEIVATIPAGPTYGDLRFNPCWDSLRGDKRFDKIVAAAKAASR